MFIVSLLIVVTFYVAYCIMCLMSQTYIAVIGRDSPAFSQRNRRVTHCMSLINVYLSCSIYWLDGFTDCGLEKFYACLTGSDYEFSSTFSLDSFTWGYRGGSPTAVQAWRTCPLWELSPSHPILVYTRGLVFTLCISFFCLYYCLCICAFCPL